MENEENTPISTLKTLYYDITLAGDKDASYITAPNNERFSEIEQEGLCNPDEFLVYTIVYQGGNTVIVSQGDIPMERVIMTWTDPNPLNIKYIRVMTYDGSDGRWLFNHVTFEIVYPVVPEVYD
jgi:hypothetical protein